MPLRRRPRFPNLIYRRSSCDSSGRQAGETGKRNRPAAHARKRQATIFGIGKAKTKLIIDTPEAAIRLKSSDNIRFIIKAVDNATDPISIINIFSFENNKKKRMAELSSVSSFGSVKSNKLERLRFSAEKYGEQSYLLTLSDKPAGEFGIIISNPNTRDEKSVIVSTFAIEE